ncbi:heavy-metal-associated domain-containing protein [Enterococcus silesiacus]|uniref:heavy-metal-associated domain-containing protein n=1 Tax=Enterococcus silesiacus TaxID=332949 RepID=UPI000900423A|nr:heavy metal-associated domain-containing protein [Enterococcus silesiacus]
MAGLTCEGCATNVRERFESVSGLLSVAVDLTTKTAKVTSDSEIDRADLEQALTGTKYTINSELV